MAEIVVFTDCLQTTLLGETLLSIHVVPGAKQSGLIEYDQWTKSLRIAVKARAEDGKANNALIYVISEVLNVPKQDIEIISGQKSRTKKIKIANHDEQLIKTALKHNLG